MSEEREDKATLPFLWWKDEWYRDEVVYPRIRALAQYDYLSNKDIARKVGVSPKLVQRLLGPRPDPLSGLVEYLSHPGHFVGKGRRKR